MSKGYEYVKERRKRRKENGWCIDCDNPPVFNRSRCAKHLAQDYARTIRSKKKRYAEGGCLTCGGPKDNNPIHNQKHKCTKCVMVEEQSRHLRR